MEFRIDDDDPSDLALTDDQWIQKWVKDHKTDSDQQCLRGSVTIWQRIRHFIIGLLIW